MMDYETIGRVAQALSNSRNAYQERNNKMALDDLCYALDQIQPHLDALKLELDAERDEAQAKREATSAKATAQWRAQWDSLSA